MKRLKAELANLKRKLDGNGKKEKKKVKFTTTASVLLPTTTTLTASQRG